MEEAIFVGQQGARDQESVEDIMLEPRNINLLSETVRFYRYRTYI